MHALPAGGRPISTMNEFLSSQRLRIGSLLLLAAASVIWTKLAPAAGFLTLVAGLALPKLESKARRLAHAGIGLAAVLSTWGFFRFVIDEAIPGVIAGGQAAATKHGLAFARSLITAQDHVRRTAAHDPDGDGIGSALNLLELAGLRPLPDGSTLSPSPLFLRGDQLVSSPEGAMVRDGAYLYKLCLPLKDGSFATNPEASMIDAESAERRFLLYAWPSVFGAGGPKQCLFLDEHETILVLEADAEGRARYHGVANSPPCNAALTSPDWTPWKEKKPKAALPGAPQD